MKISPLQLTAYYPNAISKRNNNAKDFAQNPIAQLPSFTFSKYCSYLSNISFKGKEEITPVKDDAFYSDTKGFSKYLHDKIARELKVPSLKEVKKTVKNVIKDTGAEENTVREVIARLAQFSSTRSLDCISKQFKEDDVKEVYDDGQKFSTTNFMHYIAHDKEQILREGKEKTAVFLDSAFLDRCEIKNSLGQGLLNGSIKPIFYIMDGWNGQIDGKKQLYSMFARTGSLKDIAVSVINRMQETGESFDDIFNKPIMERARKIIGNKAEIKIIKNPYIPDTSDTSDTSDEKIRSLLTPPMPSEEEIESYIDIMIDGIKNSNPPEGTTFDDTSVRILISKYLDNMLVCHSPQSLNDELVKKHRDIIKFAKRKGYDEDDIRYVIPRFKTKSFDLITYQYLLANGISEDKAIKAGSDDKLDPDLFEDNKLYIVLDDFAGSGKSLNQVYRDICQYTAPNNIIEAPLIATNKAYNLYYAAYEAGKLKPKVLPDFYDKICSHKENKLMFDIQGYEGYQECQACCVFPFMYPDNNSNLAQIFTALFLHNRYAENEYLGARWWDYNVNLQYILDRIKNSEHTMGDKLLDG